MLAVLQKHEDSRWILQHLSQDGSAEDAAEQFLEIAKSTTDDVKMVHVEDLDTLAERMYEDS